MASERSSRERGHERIEALSCRKKRFALAESFPSFTNHTVDSCAIQSVYSSNRISYADRVGSSSDSRPNKFEVNEVLDKPHVSLVSARQNGENQDSIDLLRADKLNGDENCTKSNIPFTPQEAKQLFSPSECSPMNVDIDSSSQPMQTQNSCITSTSSSQVLSNERSEVIELSPQKSKVAPRTPGQQRCPKLSQKSQLSTSLLTFTVVPHHNTHIVPNVVQEIDLNI